MAVEVLQKLVSNTLNDLSSWTLFAGILGDRPSTYAKSPSIWNPAFKALELNALYVPFDVPEGSLEPMIDVLRETPAYVGGNVTVPYKVEVMRYLDRLDPLAESIGAVNTIARDETGALVGYNTDGQGALDALTKVHPSQSAPFVESLAGSHVLLLGAGGAACAVTFYIGQFLGSGQIWIANRSAQRAAELAARLRRGGVSAEAVDLDGLPRVIDSVTLLVNATSVGQSGVRPLSGNEKTILEPYSPLAPVEAVVVGGVEPQALRVWAASAATGIAENNRRSMELLTRLPVSSPCFDVIYSPLETTLLRQSRLSGHAILNGKSMNLCQAVSAFFMVMRDELENQGLDKLDAYARVFEVMSSAW